MQYPITKSMAVANIGKDGVLQIFSSVQGGTEWFIDNSMSDPQEDPCFALDGINSGVSLTKKTEGGVTYFTGKASPVNYRSGGNGSTLRFGIYASKGSKGQKQKHVWSEKPDFIFDEKGIRNHELTAYIRGHNPLGGGKHVSLAAKVCGGKEDKGRSLIETCYPISSSDKVRANYNYEHSPYIHVNNVKQYFSGDWYQDNKWIGIKHIHIVSDDKSFTTNYLYVDTDPFDSTGKPNNNWRLKGEWVDRGTSGYKNIVCNWSSQVDKIRADGFSQVDISLFSVREIDPHATPVLTHHAIAATPEPEVIDLSKWQIPEETDVEEETITN
jgi:hypothetical protein